MSNKYYLSLEFHPQGDTFVGDIKIGEQHAFICYKGLLRVGEIISFTVEPDSDLIHSVSFLCDGIGKQIKREVPIDYVIMKNKKVNNLKTKVEELDNGFPLRT